MRCVNLGLTLVPGESSLAVLHRSRCGLISGLGESQGYENPCLHGCGGGCHRCGGARARGRQPGPGLPGLPGGAGLTYKDPQSAIAAGKTVCDMANQGKTGVEVVKVLQDANPSLSQMNAARFTAISAGVYCPAQLPPIQPSSGG